MCQVILGRVMVFNIVSFGFEVGVNQFAVDSRQFSVFPNPANETVNIKAENIKEIVVSNLLGVQMMRLPRTDFSSLNSMTIDISKLPQGIYLLRVQSNDGLRIGKVVKE